MHRTDRRDASYCSERCIAPIRQRLQVRQRPAPCQVQRVLTQLADRDDEEEEASGSDSEPERDQKPFDELLKVRARSCLAGSRGR